MPEEPHIAFSKHLLVEVIIFAGLAAAACGFLLLRQQAAQTHQVLGTSTLQAPRIPIRMDRGEVGSPTPSVSP